MADKTAPAKDNDAGKPAEAPEPADNGADPAVDETEALRAEAVDLKEKLLRTLAEMENLRRRTEREMGDARQYAVANFAREMLTVADNLRRAIDAVPAELRTGGDKALVALLDGVEVTERGLQQALTKHGVKRIEAKGQKFDPSFHQAMFEVESADTPPGTVAQEIQAGYTIGDRVLRPAFVGIAKAGAAKPQPEAKPAPEAKHEAEEAPDGGKTAPDTAEAPANDA